MTAHNHGAQAVRQFALFELGFRPFFLLASVLSISATVLWYFSFVAGVALPIATMTPVAWHGHEMIFGYTAAVMGGFLLTAVRNWTGVPTINGGFLAVLTCIWLLARILPLCDSPLLFKWAMVMDISFLLGLILAVMQPIVQVRQWRQIAIVSKLLLFLLADVLYYLGVFQIIDMGISWGLYSAVYLIMALIFTLARRVMPFFIERGLSYPVQLKNVRLIDKSSLWLLAALWLVDVFWQQALLTAVLSLILAIVHGIRLAGWYTGGIWRKPLLWVLFAGYGFFILGFLLQAVNYFNLYLPTIALHAFTYGGIGLMTLGMMARISLGHTGRNINQPPRLLNGIFACLIAGAVIRVWLPLLMPEHYMLWIGGSQWLWITAFALFLWRYFDILIRPRVDGLPG